MKTEQITFIMQFVTNLILSEKVLYDNERSKIMKRTNYEKLCFILHYNEDFDEHYLLKDCLDLLTEGQLKELFEGYQEEYEKAWNYYRANEKYYGHREEEDE